MLPSLADLDLSKLSPDARAALDAGTDIAEGVSLEEAASAHGLTLEQLKRGLERLRAEWRGQSGLIELPELDEDEYDALRASIERYGQLVPVLLDADGQIIDGRARVRICRDLGRAPHVEHLPAAATAEELESLAVAVNVARRHLTVAARRGIIRAELLRQPERSDRATALHVGVSDKTVAAVRRELEATAEIPQLPSRLGADGRIRPAHAASAPPPIDAQLPDGTVDLTLRLTKPLAESLDGGTWVDCHAVRLVLVDVGTYSLELRP